MARNTELDGVCKILIAFKTVFDKSGYVPNQHTQFEQT